MAVLHTNWQSLALDDYNPDDVGLEDYQQMRRRGSVVRFADDFLRRNVARRIGEYQHDDEAVAEWVNARIMPAVTRALYGLLGAVYYGVVLAEPVYEALDGDIALRRLFVANQSQWWTGQPVRENGELVAWKLTDGTEARFVGKAGAREVIHWAVGADDDNAWGDPAARRIYAHDWVLRQLWKWEGVGSETAALPRILLMHQSSDPDALVEAITELGANGAVAFPAAEVTQVIPLPSAFGGGSPYEAQIRRHVTGVFSSLYQPALIHTEAQFGTRAQATTQLEAWVGTETSFAEALTDEVLMPQVIQPSLLLKFGPNVDPGRLPVRDAVPPDRAQWASILASLFTVGLFDPSVEEQAQWAGELFELPVADLVKRGPQLAETPGQPAEGRAT